MKIIQCTGEGQGSCKRCSDRGIWNRVWCSLLYKVEGLEGCYCSSCLKELISEQGTDAPESVEVVRNR